MTTLLLGQPAVLLEEYVLEDKGRSFKCRRVHLVKDDDAGLDEAEVDGVEGIEDSL